MAVAAASPSRRQSVASTLHRSDARRTLGEYLCPGGGWIPLALEEEATTAVTTSVSCPRTVPAGG